MDLSGVIFVALALAWALYLIPKALRHHDEIARTRSIDRFSTAMRVLARREPVNRRDARLVVTPARPPQTPRVLLPTVEAQATQKSPRPAAARAAARLAARRRRRVLLLLLLATVVVAGVAGFGYLPWWSVSVPAVLLLGFLGLCRRQVRRDEDATWGAASETAPGTGVVPRRAIRVDAPYGTPVPASRTPGEEVSPDEDTVEISLAELEAVAVSVPTADGGSLWDPLPVTLPTYVNKTAAARTVRTIDLSQPGTWSSGHTAEDSALVEEAEQQAAEASGADQNGQRAATGT